MTNKHTRELRDLDTAELERRLQEAKDDLTGVRFGLATRQTENTARLGDMKRQIARITTMLAEREREH
ncbi:MAG: 50S ribosomal protein L29 [Chloroflexota bacterium]